MTSKDGSQLDEGWGAPEFAIHDIQYSSPYDLPYGTTSGFIGWFIRPTLINGSLTSYAEGGVDYNDYYIAGGSGDDVIFGEEGNDTIFGDYDKDIMSPSLNEEELRDLSFGDDIVVDYEGINKINTGEGNDKVSTSDFKDFDIDGDGDYSDTMTDFIGFETDENPEI